MAEHKYYLNDALKARAAREQKSQDGEIHLDDVSRVKVLSPGLQGIPTARSRSSTNTTGRP